MGIFKLNGIDYMGGGGESNVIPNPQDPATDTLTKIGINGTVYDIAGGGGGYSETNLYTASSTSFIDIPLTWSWTDYDAYLFFCNDINIQTGNPWFITQGVLTDLIETQNRLTFYPFDNAGVNYYVTTTQLTAQWNSQGFYVRQIVGLSFGGGGSLSEHNYSTTEHKVGTWTDGSTVYEKTITGTLGNTSQKTIDLSSEINCNLVIDIKGWIMSTDASNNYQIWMHDAYVRYYLRNNSLIIDKNGADNYGWDNPYTFIIRYTKTA